MHLAAEIATQRDAERVREVNVEGTRRLLEACGAAGARRSVVFTSTVVTGEAARRAADRGRRALPVQTPYGRSKQEGERAAARSGLAGGRRAPVATSTGRAAGTRRSSSRACASRGASRSSAAATTCGTSSTSTTSRAPASTRSSARRPARSTTCADDEPITYYDFMALERAGARRSGRPRRIPAWVARACAAGSNAGHRRGPQRAHLECEARARARLGAALSRRPAKGVPATVGALRATP